MKIDCKILKNKNFFVNEFEKLFLTDFRNVKKMYEQKYFCRYINNSFDNRKFDCLFVYNRYENYKFEMGAQICIYAFKNEIILMEFENHKFTSISPFYIRILEYIKYKYYSKFDYLMENRIKRMKLADFIGFFFANRIPFKLSQTKGTMDYMDLKIHPQIDIRINDDGCTLWKIILYNPKYHYFEYLNNINEIGYLEPN